MDELKKPKLLSTAEFIGQYLKKLMPLELGIYIGKDWQTTTPLNMEWKFIEKLYDYSNGKDLGEANYSSSNSIQAYIYYQYLIFIEQNYFLLNKISAKDKHSKTSTTKGDMIENQDGENKDDGETQGGNDEEEVEIINEGLFDSAYDLEAMIKESSYYNSVWNNNW